MSETGEAEPELCPADPGLDEAGYATRVEDAFIAERGTPFLVSAKDWSLIRGWRESGVPADTVVRAVREAFARRRARGQAGKISSLAYCADAVSERWEMERRGLVGKEIAPPEAGADAAATREKLAALALALRAGGFNRAAEQIEEISPDLPFEEIEHMLSSVEASLVRAGLKAMNSSFQVLVEERVASALGDVSGLAPHVVARMHKALTRREVRKLARFPPLTLLNG
jgi:hypothetical protein